MNALRSGTLIHQVAELRRQGWACVMVGYYKDGSHRMALLPPTDLRREFIEAWYLSDELMGDELMGDEPPAVPPLDSFPLAELPCPACAEPRYVTPHGEVCKNGHGG